jgi:hypothetical protein
MEMARPLGVELDHPVTLRVVDVVTEDRRAPLELLEGPQETFAAVEDVVPQDERDRVAPDERLRDVERLGDALRLGLLAILDGQAPLRAVAEQLPEARQILRRRDQAELTNAALDQRRERVINHGFVVHRLELLAGDERQRIQPGAGAAGQDDAFHAGPE